MEWTFLLLDAVPLLAFVVIDRVSNTRYALIGALSLAALELGFSYLMLGQIDRLSLFSAGLIILFGGLALKFNNALFFKFKPVVLNVIMALLFFVTYAMGHPLLLWTLERYSSLLPPAMQTQLQHPLGQLILQRSSFLLGFGFLLHAAAVAWAALRLSNWGWFAVRTFGGYGMLIAISLISALSVR